MAALSEFGRKSSRGMALAPPESWSVTGLFLLLGYFVLVASGWHWARLSALQDIELYKQLTGGTLVLLVVAQWRLTVARVDGAMRAANRQLVAHRSWGVLAPLLLYLHADEFGHAYVRVMCWAFLALVALGLLHPSLSRFNRPLVQAAWLVTHVALAAGLIWLIGYHAFNAFYYE